MIEHLVRRPGAKPKDLPPAPQDEEGNHLTLRSIAQRCVSKGGNEHRACRPSFETRPAAAPQDEEGDRLPSFETRPAERIEIVPATLDHARALRLREGDAVEVAAFGVTKEEAPRVSMLRALWAETYLVDGEPAAIVGLGRSALVGGHGVPWLLTGPACERHRKRFLAESRRQVARMLGEVSPLINFVHADYRRAVRWFEWLGFTLDAPLAINGAPFRRFIKEA